MALELLETGVVSNIPALTTVDSSDEEDVLTPKNKKFSQKKRLVLSDDEDEVTPGKSPSKSDSKSASESEEEEQLVKVNKKRSRLVLANSSSEEEKEKDDSDGESPTSKKDFGLRKLEKKSFDMLKKKNKVHLRNSSDEESSERDGDEDSEVQTKNQKKILDNLRAQFGSESSDEEERLNNDCLQSNMSNHSELEVNTKKKAAPQRKSAVACRAAMEKEKQKMISENQRMVRESAASLPYHKPKQRSLKEFLSARPRASLELKGAKPSSVDITVIGKELEQTEKLAEEFYKAESEEEEESLTPPAIPSPSKKEDVAETVVAANEAEEMNERVSGVETAKKTLDFDELSEKLDLLEKAQGSSDTEMIQQIDELPKVAGTDDSTESAMELNENVQMNEELGASATHVGELITDGVGEDAKPTESVTSVEKDSNIVFVEPALPKESSDISSTDQTKRVEDSLEEISLFLEDTDEVLNCEPKAAQAEPKKTFDLLEVFDTHVSSDEEKPKEKSPEKAKVLLTRAQFLEKLRNSKPVRLSGGPSEIIDLSNPSELSKDGIHDLKERFIRNVTAGKKKSLDPKQEGLLNLMKAGEKIGDEVDMSAQPGSRMCMFKSELQESIAKQRKEDFKQRQNEYKMYEDETDELLGNDFGDDEKEEKDIDEFDPHLANETESEPELEDDEEFAKSEKPRVKSAFVEEEAEEDEIEDEDAPLKMDEDCADDEDDDDDADDEEDCDEESAEEDDSDRLTTSTPGAKKQFSRIIRIEDSDDEDETDMKKAEGKTLLNHSKVCENDKMDDSNGSMLNTSVNLSTTSILDSPQTIGNYSKGKSDMKMMGDLYDPTQPTRTIGLISSGITQLFEDAEEEGIASEKSFDLNTSALRSPANLDKFNFDVNSPTTDLEALCSGQFLTAPSDQTQNDASVPAGLVNLVSSEASQPANVADLCSGQFVTQVEVKKSGFSGLVCSPALDTQNLESLCSGQFITQAETKNQSISGLDAEEVETANLESLCSGQFVTQPSNGAPKDLQELIDGETKAEDTQDLAALCSGNFVTQADTNNTEDEPPAEEIGSPQPESHGAKLVISSDDDGDEVEAKPKGKKLKKKKKKRKLEFSDDEEDDENVESEAEEGADFSLVDYDSEENEVVIQPGQLKSKAAKFFEAEAELSGSDWESADEDERGLDDFEEELGDQEQIDEDNVKEQLGQIHARRLLDDDKRDIRLFQEAFLEDGDLHAEGGGRQKLFRWKNTDDGDWQGGCNPNLSGDEGLNDDDEDDAAWRTMRLERENWLKENSSQEITLDTNDQNSKLLSYGKNVLAKINGAKLKAQLPQQNEAEKKQQQPLHVKSPGKAILQRLQGKSGSFFSRKKISLNKVVQITGADNDGIVSNISKGNFVFSTISPSSLKGPANENADVSFEDASPQPVKAKKREAAKNTSTNPRVKRQKVSNSIFKLL
ncbi:claspin-like [Cloeon dipterum]|uniref:claspin-like n=1 Tax=Cloeon dipterum TaxID=197152 RepID=UPI00321F9C5C